MRIACVDLGSSTIAVAIADLHRQAPAVIRGRGWAPAVGLERGDVVDLAAAGRAVAAALEAAERSAGGRVGQAVVAVTGKALTAVQRRGQLTIGREPAAVTRKHASRALASVVAAGADAGQELLHVIPCRFWIDGRHVVRNPLGMPACRLEVEAHTVSAGSAAIRTALRCVQDQGLDVRELVAAPLAAAEAALTPAEREAGVMLVDLGGASTGAVVYTQGAPVATTLVPMGGRQITSDVAMVLRVSLRQAERLKLSYGRAGSGALPDRLLEVPEEDALGGEPVSHRLLCEVIEARLEEIFEQVMRAVADTGFSAPLPAGVVLTGGGAALPEADAVARRLFALPARAATVRLPGAAGDAGPAWATVAGLTAWLQRGQPELLPDGNLSQGTPVGRLMRQLLPLGGE